MKATSFITTVFICAIFTKSTTQSADKTLQSNTKGKVIMYENLKSDIVQSRNVEVFLPADYDENRITKKFEGADHTEKSWNARAHIPILFMLAK